MDLISIIPILRHFYLLQEWTTILLHKKNFRGTNKFYLNEIKIVLQKCSNSTFVFQLGLCVSRGTATVLNLCGALILLPQCKKLNQILYRILSKLWPGLFFFWLEKAKSFHMTVATTLVIFGGESNISKQGNLNHRIERSTT